MKKMEEKVRYITSKEVSVKDLSTKLFPKYMNFIQKEVDAAVNERNSLVPLSWQRQGITETESRDNSFRQINESKNLQNE